MKTILVHVDVKITKKFEVAIPEDVHWEEIISRRLQNGDPLFNRKNLRNVLYDPSTEVPISARYFLKEESRTPSSLTEALNAKCRHLQHYLQEDQSPLEAYDLLLYHTHMNGEISADFVVSMADEFRNQFTVNQLLSKVLAGK